MVARTILGSFASPLLLVLVPLAAMAGAVVLAILVAVSWMSIVHGLLARLDGRVEVRGRLPTVGGAVRDDGRREP